MKKTQKIFFLLSTLSIVYSCVRLLEQDPTIPNWGNIDYTKPVLPDSPENGAHSTGLNTINCSFTESPQPYDSIIIEKNLPISYDLSSLMPPVKSQGIQGSCVAFATTYYMKSYQEKLQYGYEYDNYEKVMSPAYVFNQCKSSSDCSLGTCIEAALGILKQQGTVSWKEFPYDENNCSRLPTIEQKKLAEVNKIKSFHQITANNTTADYTVVKIMKTLLFNKTPLVIGMRLDKNFQNSFPKDDKGTYIFKEYDEKLKIDPHAMLIVGYDDDLQSFKVINSWGVNWGNEGYCYISYDFFRDISDPLYKSGLLGVYFTIDNI